LQHNTDSAVIAVMSTVEVQRRILFLRILGLDCKLRSV